MVEKVGQLNICVEGAFWNAYYVMPDTTENSIFLGGIALRFVQNHERKDKFIELMREAMSDLIEEITGERPNWNNPKTVMVP